MNVIGSTNHTYPCLNSGNEIQREFQKVSVISIE